MAGRKTIAQVERERDLAKGDAARLETEAAQLRAQVAGTERMIPASLVARVARKAKREENWCESGFRAAMEELALDPEDHKVSYEVEVKLTLTIVPEDDETGYFDPSEDTDEAWERDVRTLVDDHDYNADGNEWLTDYAVEIVKVTKQGHA